MQAGWQAERPVGGQARRLTFWQASRPEVMQAGRTVDRQANRPAGYTASGLLP
jgi:hypothetical protein